MFRKIWGFLKSYGLAAAVGHVSGRVRQSLVPPTRRVFCARLADLSPAPEPENARLGVVAFPALDEIPSSVLDELFAKGTIDDRKPASREAVLSFAGWLFSRGATFWACHEGTDLVGYLWSLRGSREAPRFHFFPLGEQDAVFLAHEIFPPFRGRELNRRMTHLVLAEMKAQGVERVYVDVLLTNRRSLKSFSRTHFKPIGQARMKIFKKRQLVIWSRPKDQSELL